MNKPLFVTSEWNFDLIRECDQILGELAKEFGLDTYPNQIEVISSEQMMDAYSSVGMPIGYYHWSYGKKFIQTEQNYKRGHMGLAYEIVINSNPCIAYLMEENTLPMQALVMAPKFHGAARAAQDPLAERRVARLQQTGVEKDRLIRHHRIALDLLTLAPAERERLVQQARDTVERWRREQLSSRDYVDRWAALLALPLHQLAREMVSDADGWGTALRQNSPWVGLHA